MGLGYLHSYLMEHKINSEQINLDNLLHRKTDFWKKFDTYGTLTDDSIIEQYINDGKVDIDFDTIYLFLTNAIDWKKYDMLAVSYDIAFLRDIYAPAFFKFLNEISVNYKIPVVLGGLGFANLDILKICKRFDFIKYACFGKIDSINLESFLKIIQYENNESSRVCANFAKKVPSPKIEKNYIVKPFYDLKNNKGFGTTYRDFCEIDSGLPDNYFNDDLEISIIPYRFSVNCINKCAFCMCSAEGYRFTFKEAEKVADDLDRLVQENASNCFMFLNSMINFSKKYLSDLLNLMQKRNIQIYFTDSAEVFGMDDEMLQIIKEMGGIALWYGLECPSDRLLKFIHKRCTVQEAESVLKRSDDLGIWNGVNLISGLPQESDADVEMTIDFIKKNIGIADMWQVTPFYLVKSKFLENPKKYGITIRDREVIDDKGEGDLIMASFDEENGLKWEEKREKTAKNFKLLLETIDNHAIVPNLSNMTLLFFLYKKFNSSKNRVKEWLIKNYKGYAPKIRITGLE
jgi:radical SAM superfamily enzyme YgiQ (UPF0313 family)